MQPLPLPPASAIQSPQLSPLPFPVVPQCLTFADSPSPLVISLPNLPQREPIAQRTQSRAPAPPLTLFADARPYHERVTYHMPTAKTTRALPGSLGFAGLCEAFSLSPKESNGFANLCSSLDRMDCFDLSALSVLDPATGEFLKHCQLCRDPCYKAVWDTSYANKLGWLCQALDLDLRHQVKG